MPQRNRILKLPWPKNQTLVIQNGGCHEIKIPEGDPTYGEMVRHGISLVNPKYQPTEDDVLTMIKSAKTKRPMFIIDIHDAKN